MIQFGCCCMILRLFIDLLFNMDIMYQVRVKSCYKNDIQWPLMMAFYEIVLNFLPLLCFTKFFSTDVIVPGDD